MGQLHTKLVIDHGKEVKIMDKKVIRADPCPCKKDACKDKACPYSVPCAEYRAWNKRNYGK